MSHNKAVLIGVGFAGCKILSKIKSDVAKVFIDTDKDVEEKYSGLRIGENFCGNYSACDDIYIGEAAAIESKNEILAKVNDFQNWIIIAPMGGGTSCGTTKKLVEFAYDNKKLVTVVTNMAFEWEADLKKIHAAKTLLYIENFCELKSLKFNRKDFLKAVSVNEIFDIVDEYYLKELHFLLNDKFCV